MASQPGFAAAAQLLQAPSGKQPLLAVAKVLSSRDKTEDRLDALASQIRLSQNKLRLVLEPGEYQFLQAEIPQIPDNELKNALRWQVKDMLRTPLEETTIDVIAPAENGHGQRRSQGFVVAAGNTLLRERLLQFRPYKSEVDVIDIPELAQRNMANLLEEEGHTTVILSITASGSLLTASRNGVLHFTRNFDFSSQMLAASEALRREQFDRLLLELQRSIDALEHQYSFLSSPSLWLAPFAHVDELLALLIDNLYLPVRPIHLEEIFDCSLCAFPDDLEQQAALFHALGLCLRGKESA